MNGDRVNTIQVPQPCNYHQLLTRLNNTVNIRLYPVTERKRILMQLIPSLKTISLNSIPDLDLLFACCLG